MIVATRIRDKLTRALAPERLEIVDESGRHAGHAGARHPGATEIRGETHFHVEIVAAAFEGEGRVERQRRVYAILADELKSHIHALSLVTLTPAEAQKE
jgi:BolA family transcriptional regulator, general stress-responsive regulator